MALYRSKETTEAITFKELIEYGKANGGIIENGKLMKFNFYHIIFTRVTSQKYMICEIDDFFLNSTKVITFKIKDNIIDDWWFITAKRFNKKYELVKT
jgi:hypothetical protein